MKTMKPLSWKMLALAGTLAVLAWATPALLLAQDPEAPPPPRVVIERTGEADCRCVDADGNEIEDCVCITTGLRNLRGQLEGLRGGLEGLRGGLEGLRSSMQVALARRARIGVSIDYGQNEAAGAVIRDVMDGSPAEEAGLRVGDVVTHVAGRSLLEPLEDQEEEQFLDEDQSVAVQRFVRVVGDLEPDAPVEMRVERDGRSLTLEITPEPARGLGFSRPDREERVTGSYRFFPEGDGPTVFRFEADSLRRGIDSLQVRLRPGLEPLEEMRWRFELDDDEGPMVYRFQGPDSVEALRILGDSATWRGFRRGEVGPLAVVRGLRRDACAELRGGGWPLDTGTCVAGADLIDLNPDLGSYFGTDEGVLVAQVAEVSPLGLRAGDVILAIDGREVRSAAHALRILQSYESDEEIRLRVLREGNEREVMGRRR